MGGFGRVTRAKIRFATAACGNPRRRAPPAGIGWVHAQDDEPPELTYVDIDIFEATF